MSGDLNCFSHISSSWVEISLLTEFQLPRLSGSRFVIFMLNPICFISFFCVRGVRGHKFWVHISSSWVEICLDTKFQLPGLPGVRHPVLDFLTFSQSTSNPMMV